MGAERVAQGESPNTRNYTVGSWLRSQAATEGTTRCQDSDTTSIGGSRSVTFSMQARRTASTWTSVYDSESDSELPGIKLPARRVNRSQHGSSTRSLEQTRTGSRLWTILKNNMAKKKKNTCAFPAIAHHEEIRVLKVSLEREALISNACSWQGHFHYGAIY
jgi:hypothetical protein